MSRKKMISTAATRYLEELTRKEESNSVRAKPFSQLPEPDEINGRSDRRRNGIPFYRWETQS